MISHLSSIQENIASPDFIRGSIATLASKGGMFNVPNPPSDIDPNSTDANAKDAFEQMLDNMKRDLDQVQG